MAKHQDPHREPAERAHRGDNDDDKHGPGPERERGPKAEREIFVDLVRRRMAGGAKPSTEAYATAMQHWRQLPGALTFTAIPVFPESETQDGVGEGEATEGNAPAHARNRGDHRP